MLILNSPQVVQETVLRWKQEGKIAFVPTMGCLHEGHLQLVRRAKQYGQRTIVSIFVNPLQFGPKEDLANYPRPIEEDKEKLRALGVDLLFLPSVEDLYPVGFRTKVVPTVLTDHMEGSSRPGHFEGVATVCLKLFLTTQADFAVFGEKDFQQLRVIQQLTADFNMPLTILPHPTVREADGLALSSRNRYLSPGERDTASRFPASLSAAQRRGLTEPTVTAGATVSHLKESLSAAGIVLDYAVVASEWDLIPADGATRLGDIERPRLFAAVKVGRTRLIDNWKLYLENT